LMTFTGQSFEAAIESLRGNLVVMDQYAQGQTHFVRYEQMLPDPGTAVRGIANYLGVAFDDALLARIDELSNLETSKKVCEDLRHRPQGQYLRSAEDHRVDPQTWLHHNHIHSGEVGRWRNEFTPAQIETANQVFAPWLERLAYTDPPATRRAG